jgi:hypothetical protein
MLALLITALRTGWRELISWLTDPYRPELHYMRGPGPKHRAKSGIGKPSAGSPRPDKS